METDSDGENTVQTDSRPLGWVIPVAVPSEGEAVLRRWIAEHEREWLIWLRQLLLRSARGRYPGQDRKSEIDELARDLLVEVVARALSSCDRFDPARPPKAWLMGIANKVVLQWDRDAKDGRQRIVDSADAEDVALPTSDIDELMARHDAEHVLKALARLLDWLPRHREVLIAATMFNGDSQKMGVHLNIASGCARTRLHRARKAAAAELGKRGYRSLGEYLDGDDPAGRRENSQ